MAKSNGSHARATAPAAPPPQQPERARPTQVLPTNRIAFQKQLDSLRAFGAASEPNRRAVQLTELAGIIGLHVNTLSLINPFFVDAQFVQRTPEGFIPAQEVVDYTRAYEWNKETAAQRLAPIISRTWFAQAVVPKLRYRAVSEAEAIQDLANAATAPPHYRGHLETLLDYMQAAGLIARENEQVRLLQAPTASAAPEPPRTDATTAAPSEQREASTTPRHSPVSTSFANPTAGVVQFQVSVKVDMAEFAGWEPQRITSFFAGIAQVLAAKGAIEEQTTEM
jgi:hypothetical protein